MAKLRIPRPSRRQFLRGTAAAGVMAAGGAAWIMTDDPVDFIVTMIKRSVPYIEFEEGAVKTFARTYIERVEPQRQGNILKISKVVRGLGLTITEAMLKDNEKYENFRRTTVSTFLISTDYFDEGRDTSKPVEFVGVYACGRNPFAQFT